MDSTSESVNFGLLSTVTAINLFGSRIRMARSSRVPSWLSPFLGDVHLRQPLHRRLLIVLIVAISGSGAVSTIGLSASGAGTSRGSTPRFAKNSRISGGTSFRARKAESTGRGIIPSVALAAAATSARDRTRAAPEGRVVRAHARRVRLVPPAGEHRGHVAAAKKVDEGVLMPISISCADSPTLRAPQSPLLRGSLPHRPQTGQLPQTLSIGATPIDCVVECDAANCQHR